ncbi:MAG: hypothetical protein ACJAZI_001719 [Cycloclasticus sp.]|jgi:uncharacterized protein (DUF2164 family)
MKKIGTQRLVHAIMDYLDLQKELELSQQEQVEEDI